MSSKVGIVELAAHNEVVWAYAKILLHITDDVTIFTNEFTYKQLYDLHDLPTIQWVIQENEDNETFITKNIERLNELDSVIFSTILPPDFKFFSETTFTCKTFYVIHDANYFFFPRENFFTRQGIVNTSKDTIKRLRFFVQNEAKRNESFLRSFSGLLVPSESVYKYLKEKGVTATYNIVGVMNFAVNTQKPDPVDVEDIKIVVPGSISNKSRDYDPVIDSLRIIRDKMEARMTVTILGRAMDVRGKKTLSKLDVLNSETLTIETYSSFIQQDEFDRKMKQATFLILPVNEIMQISTIKEWNGYTCVSGNINDMIKYGKPSLIPSYYPVDESMEGMIRYYKDSNDLVDKIENYTDQLYSQTIASCLKSNSARSIAQKIKQILI